jgi:general secretion pathway protein J
VVTALLGLLSVLVFGGLRFGSLSWTRAERHRLDTADMTAALSVLRDAISRAYPEFATRNVDDPTVAFDGGPDILFLVTPLPAAIEAGVLSRETFSVTSDETGHQALFMTWRLDLPAADESAPPRTHRVMLADHLDHVAFQYFGRIGPDQPARWLDRWSGRDRLPDMIRIHIAREKAAGGPWPDLIVEPKATTNVTCLYDPAYSQCRRMP